MSSCLSENTIAQILDERLSLAERQRVDRHIDVCAACRSLIARLLPGGAASAASPGIGDTWIGRTIGPYQLVKRLGRGGMGTVYEAFYPHIGRRAAVKVLLPAFSEEPDLVARFLNEGRAVNQIRHPNIVDIYEVNQLSDGTAYILMEYLEGETLQDRLQREGPISSDSTAGLGRQLASALAAAHAQGIVHRDLKPGNVMLVPDPSVIGGERAILLDFGIAKLNEATKTVQVRTQTNMIMGTPRYMAPEQCHGARAVDDKADVYALGIMLYEMLSGRVPFDGEGNGEIMAMHLYQAPPQLKSLVPELRAELTALVHRLLMKDKDQRPSMHEVFEELGLFGVTTLFPSSNSPQTSGQLIRTAGALRWLLGAGAALAIASLVLLPKLRTPPPTPHLLVAPLGDLQPSYPRLTWILKPKVTLPSVAPSPAKLPPKPAHPTPRHPVKSKPNAKADPNKQIID